MILRDRCGSVNSDVELGWMRTTKPNNGYDIISMLITNILI